MEIYISNAGQTPIYAQITAQIREKILTGELQAGDALPSIRLLAKDLRISVITTKRAYEDLEQEGFIHTLPGKGSFVAAQNRELLREQTLKRVEEFLEQAVDAARVGGVTPAEVREMLALLYEE
ncbi:MAG: GntR family transcriptional regulator [Oscillospiraceae bacterium]|nr:GntR family transcriptional regulator [Oscillospiraceae bacterium]